MDNKIYTLLICLVVIMTIMPLVNAEPPFQSNIQDHGLTIEVAYSDVYKINENRFIHNHVYNSNGSLIPTSSLSCYYHAYSHNQGGAHIINNGTMTSYGVGFNATINGSYYQTPGLYSIMQWCNTSTEGGFYRYNFYVTPSGTIPSTSQGIIYSILLLTSLALMTFFYVFSYSLDGKNKYTMGGDLIELNINKFFKLGLFFAGYLFMIFSSYIAWQISFQFLLLDFGTAIFKTLFTTLWIFAIPLFIFVVIMGIMKWLFDLELHKLAERGLKPR